MIAINRHTFFGRPHDAVFVGEKFADIEDRRPVLDLAQGDDDNVAPAIGVELRDQDRFRECRLRRLPAGGLSITVRCRYGVFCGLASFAAVGKFVAVAVLTVAGCLLSRGRHAI